MAGELELLERITRKILAYRRPPSRPKPRVAEFFAGIGLVRLALSREGFKVVFANDIEPTKARLYKANFDASDFILGDVRDLGGADVPDIELATASFPCTDLSLAGKRKGLSGQQSGMFWEFARILREMGKRRPPLVLLENVLGFASSKGGKDLVATIDGLNRLGYRCDILVSNASWFIPQSRPRMFIVGATLTDAWEDDWSESSLRPAWVGTFASAHPELKLHARPLTQPAPSKKTIADYVERLSGSDSRWWDTERLGLFLDSLSPLQTARIDSIRRASRLRWATAYRRTRNGEAIWEVRPDALSGCLRTARGGSSKQAIVEAGHGRVRVRWMMVREYARLQGAPNFKLGDATENAALFGFGDAVCVPVISWLARSYLQPVLQSMAA